MYLSKRKGDSLNCHLSNDIYNISNLHYLNYSDSLTHVTVPLLPALP